VIETIFVSFIEWLMSSFFGTILIYILFFSTSIVSFHLSVKGFLRITYPRVFNSIQGAISTFSFLYLFMILPMLLGSFARGEVSPLPWVRFVEQSLRHGFADGFFSALTVLIVDLWLFWIPANIWVNRNPQADNLAKVLARIINVLVGLILVQSGNPIYQFLFG